MEKKHQSNKYQRAIYGILHDRPVAFSPKLSQVLGSNNAAILIGQLLYWTGKGAHDPWIFKTIEDMKEETGLSRSEQDTAIRKCKKKGVLKTELRQIPAKRFFLVDFERLIDLIDEWAQNNPQALRIDPLSIAGLRQSITDTTHIKQQETTTPSFKKVKKKVRLKMNNEIMEAKKKLVKSKKYVQSTNLSESINS